MIEIFADPQPVLDIGQCDACSSLVAAESNFYQCHDSLHQPYVCSGDTVHVSVSDTYQCMVTPHSKGAVLLNNEGTNLLSLFEHPRSLGSILALHVMPSDRTIELRGAIDRMRSLGLLRPAAQPPPMFSEAVTTLIAWLHITDRCNLRCKYCYLPHGPVDMSLETGLLALNALFRSALRHGYQRVKVKYAGGEPLLRFSVVKDLHQYARVLAANCGLQVDGVVLSNGTLLTPEIVEEMQKLELRLMVSLDGLGEFQDCQRPYTDGSGSSSDVILAIELALWHGLVPDISVTITGENVDGLPNLMAWVLEKQLPFSLNLCRESDYSLQKSERQTEEHDTIEKLLLAYRVVQDHLPGHTLLGSLADRANLSFPHLYPCRVGRDYLVFNPYGGLAKCQMDMQCIIGDADNSDPVGLLQGSGNGIQNIRVDEKVECRECSWRYWCAGGCPLMAYRSTGHYEAKTPSCRIYQSIFPEIIRLEGLRLLAIAKPSTLS